jgi:hypothetical protein
MIMTDHARMKRGCSHERVWTFEQQELDREARADERVCWECIDRMMKQKEER